MNGEREAMSPRLQKARREPVIVSDSTRYGSSPLKKLLGAERFAYDRRECSRLDKYCRCGSSDEESAES